jgi:hypothetical protein
MVGAWYNQVLVFTRDVNGRNAVNFLSALDQSALVNTLVDNLVTAYQAVSAANVFAAQFQATKLYTGATTPSAYDTTLDRANLVVQAVGATTRVGIVAPLPAIFMSNNYTVDLSNTQVAAFISALEAVAGVGPTAAMITGIRKGYRMQVKAQNL